MAAVAVRWVPSHEARGFRKITETDRIGNNGADALANAAAKKAGPTDGQRKHYANRQNLCIYVQKTRDNSCPNPNLGIPAGRRGESKAAEPRRTC
eukprot:14334626-Heterocapsa_arctica.AAC.1